MWIWAGLGEKCEDGRERGGTGKTRKGQDQIEAGEKDRDNEYGKGTIVKKVGKNYKTASWGGEAETSWSRGVRTEGDRGRKMDSRGQHFSKRVKISDCKI